jgi:hypothetical protein
VTEIIKLALRAGTWLVTTIIETVKLGDEKEFQRVVDILPEDLQSELMLERSKARMRSELEEVLGG